MPKPAYRALQLVAEHPTTGIPVTATSSSASPPSSSPGTGAATPAAPGSATSGTVDVIVGVEALDGTTRVVALLVNFNIIGGSWALNCSAESVTFVLQGLPPGVPPPTTASITRIDSKNAYAKAVWVAAGKPTYPSPLEVAQEQAASALVGVQVPLTAAPGGGVAVTLVMEPQSVAQLVIVYDTRARVGPIAMSDQL